MNYGLVLMVIAIGIFTACDDGDDATPNASACFNYSPTEELETGTEITFTSCSENATIFAWDFGDGHMSTEENPTHTYETGSDFTVKMIASNEISVDTVVRSITIKESNALIGTWEWVSVIEYETIAETFTFNTDYTGNFRSVFTVDVDALPEGTTYDGPNPKIEESSFNYTVNDTELIFVRNGETSIFPYSLSGSNLTIIFDGEARLYLKK